MAKRKSYLDKKGNVKKCCLNCTHFTWWDNDFCCIPRFAILQHDHHNNGIMTEELEKNMRTPDNCEYYEYRGERYSKDYEEEYKKYRKFQDQIEILENHGR